MAIPISQCTLTLLSDLRDQCDTRYLGLRPVTLVKTSGVSVHWRSKCKCKCHPRNQADKFFRKFTVLASTEGSSKSSQSDERIPSWAAPDSDEPPPWDREEVNGSNSQQIFEIPFYAYLLASAVTAIAAIGSIFEYINQKPVFGVLDPDNMFYAPLLAFFALTGIPMSAFLWFKSVQVANKESEEQDRRDGY